MSGLGGIGRASLLCTNQIYVVTLPLKATKIAIKIVYWVLYLLQSVGTNWKIVLM